MRQRGMMLFIVLGLIPFLMAFRFGGEIRYGDPTKFQVNSNGYSGFENIVVGDVDGDGDQDLIMIYAVKGTATEARNEVRLYLNQNHELGGPDPTALGGTPSGTVQATDTLFSNSNTNGTGNMYIIYQDGWSGTQGTNPSFGRVSGNRITGFDSTNDIRSCFTGLAVAYKTVNAKEVVDYIVVSREYGNPTAPYYSSLTSYTPRQYAGRLIHLKNPYTGANPLNVKGPWGNRAGTANHTGNAMNFDATTPDPDHDATPSTAQFYNDDYTFKGTYGDANFRITFNAIALAKLDADGDYDLYTAPRVYINASNTGDNISGTLKAQIWRYLNDGTNNFNNAYNDSSSNNNYLWSDGSSGGTYCQFHQFRLVDMDKNGIPDLLGAQGGGSSAPLSWIEGQSTGSFRNTNCKNATLNSAGTFWDINAGNLRAPTSGTSGDNNNGYPDLVLTRLADPQIEISMYSNTSENTPGWSTYADWQAVYTAPSSETTDPTNTWMWNLKFGRLVIADVDNDGENEIIVTIKGHTSGAGGRTAQYWIFKKSTTRYLTMNFDELR